MRMFIRVFTVLALCCGLLTLSAQAANDGAVTLSEGLKEIEAEAFSGNAGMTSLVIPKTVNSIGSRAFASCTGLREVYLGKNTSLKIAADAFAGCGDIHFNAYPDTPGELFALAHGYRCDRLEDGSPFLERALQLVTQNGGTMSILQSADFSTRRLVVRMEGDRLPDISAYKPTKIVHKQEDGIYFVQFATVQDTVDCYGLLKNREGSDVIFVEPDACVEVIDDVEAVGTVSGKAWDTDDPMGFDAYAPYVSENSSGKVTIAIIDSGVKRLSAYSGMLRADGVNLVSDGKSWSEDGMVHGSMIAGIIHDCVGTNNVDILPIRVVSGGNVADCSMIALGIDYAVERGADIINLSLNFDENEYVRYAIGKALDAGVRVVVAAGNSHRLIDKVFPANVPGTTVVSGIDSDYRLSGSSNYGANVSYCAPDTDVVSTAYASMTRKGTSFSAPMVASALALAKLDSTHTESDLRTVCRQLTPVVNGENNYGNGLMQLDKLTNEDITIKYDANGGENAPAFQIKVPGISILLTEEEPTRNYRVTLDDGTGKTTELLVAAAFSGWNTSANGSGTSYAPGANYIREESVTLYAQWEGGSLKDLPTPTREGYRFEGWYTAATGGSLVTRQNVITRNVTLYAHWTKLKTYTVTYDANGGTGAPGSQIKWEGVDLTLSTVKPTRTSTIIFVDRGEQIDQKTLNNPFASWNTSANGSGTSYASSGTYTEDASRTLYARWNSVAIGTMPVPTRSGYTFKGWYGSETGSVSYYTTTMICDNVTLYARWEKNPELTGITVRTQPTKTSYYRQDALNTSGLALNCYYDDGSSKIITSGFTCLPTTLNESGDQTITVSYGGLTTDFQVSVDNRIGIYNATDLSRVTTGNDYILLYDIDLSSWGTWTPLCGAVSAAYGSYYEGTFDGNGHTISNMSVSIVTSGSHANGGLFGRLEGAVIKNLTIRNGSIYAESSLDRYSYSRAYAGAICGEASDTIITNCANINTSVTAIGSDDSYAGGILGVAESSCTVTGCSNSGHIHGEGIHGITRCIIVGGVVGWKHYSDSTITNCTNSGSVTYDTSQMLPGSSDYAYKGDIIGR